MKRALCLVILLAGAAVGFAVSNINIYITSEDDATGLGQVMSNDQLPGERFDQTKMNFVPYFTSPGTTLLNHGNSPNGTGNATPFIQTLGTTKTYYLWADLTEDPNSVGANRVARLGIYGLDLTGCHTVGTNAIGQSAEYRQMDDGDNTRWDSNDPVPCFNGLQSLGNGALSFVGTDLQYTTGTGVAGRTTHVLLGAFEFVANQAGDGLYLGLGPLFAQVRAYKRTGTSTYTLLHDYDTTGGGYYPNMFMNGMAYQHGTGIQQLAITCIPPKPYIISQPQSQIACLGQPVTLSVTAGGGEPLAYQWRKNLDPIAGATQTTYTIDPVGTSDAGTYDVIVSNAYDSATSAEAVLTVHVGPSITQQPQGHEVNVGSSATFTIGASGTAPLTYQWRRNGVNLSDDGRITGSTTPTLTIDLVGGADVGSYDVVVTNDCGAVTSDLAMLRMPSCVQWNPRNVTGPSPRILPAMAYDGDRHVTVLFGGGTVDGASGDTWEWNGTLWTLQANTGPAPRYGHAMAYDEQRHAVILFGGSDGNVYFDDIWQWDGYMWTPLPLHGPAIRWRHAMVYDSVRGVIVLYGGHYGNTYFGDTWELDQNGWHLRAIDGPPALRALALAFDAAHSQTVLFGGADSNAVTRGETWTWNGSQWTRLAVIGPAPRQDHAMAYDAEAARIVLFGGAYSTTLLADAWTWNGAAWTWANDAGPSGRQYAQMAYDAMRGVTVLFGGADAIGRVGDTWEGGVPAPEITQPPVSHVVLTGHPAVFSVQAIGHGPLAYQWRKDGANLSDGGRISGVNTVELTVTDGVPDDSGAYDVVVWDSCDFAVSPAAQLVVPRRGDLNCDGVISYADINAFVLALNSGAQYAAKYPNCDRNLADCNQDGYVDYGDINPFVRLLSGSK